ncbi:epoxyalkane--coenzyme M transferase [Paeniroseomonas aquatica]|uniref:Epoxyalkane--coenzyme M transferase n=1 Tax=Paeniroseomonas aquatica TaxID=373043 RepID=A0ABT8AFP6_9PROT|nr:epoxyalkane--coenzyme M transferase [Paeniroseomonas aquatica]MDN3568652.1 epoxyalkane--coenzyme M transferase [Paeniroseomonas aquatica]
MQHSEHRILTTHTGSLPRPPGLTQLYARRARGEAVDAAAIDAAGREALRHIVPAQCDAGLDVINNGEQQRDSFALYLRHRLTGIGGESSRTPFADIDAYPEFKAEFTRQAGTKEAVSNTALLPAAIGPVAYADRGAIEAECDDFAAALAPAAGRYAEAFLTAPSPGIIASIVQNRHYATEEAYLAALAEALAVEYRAVVARGWVLQLDCPDLALERHCSYRDRPLADFLGFVERVVTAINRALAGIPRDRVRLHVCWGNYEAPHDQDVPLEEILPILLRAEVGGLVLPFANPRHAHEIRCLTRMPLADDQLMVAGVIDTLTNFVEHPEVVADRILQVARAVGDPRRVLAGTDCGFDTSAGRGRVASDVVWAKLRSLAEGARLASAQLFPAAG